MKGIVLQISSFIGTVKRHVVRATNTGWFPVSYRAEKNHLNQFGLHVTLKPVHDLPGTPDHEVSEFVVSFDPRGANLGLGEIDTVLPINVCIILSNSIMFFLSIF